MSAELHWLTLQFRNLPAGLTALLSLKARATDDSQQGRGALWTVGPAENSIVGLNLNSPNAPLGMQLFSLTKDVMQLSLLTTTPLVQLSAFVRTDDEEISGDALLPVSSSLTIRSSRDIVNVLGMSSWVLRVR